MIETPDIVVVGSGIAGGAISAVMAAAGFSVLILERDTQLSERVRGEWMVPWGVKELQQIDLHDVLVDAGAHHVKTHIPYSDEVTPDEAERASIDLSALIPGVPGALALGHSVMCDAFGKAAEANDAILLRGVRRITVEPGQFPNVKFVHEEQAYEIRPRLVIGADGRASNIAKQAGIAIHKDQATHLVGGLLVKNANSWPQDVHTLGTENNNHFAICPQGGGNIRIYLTAPLAKRQQIDRSSNPIEFLRGFHLNCAPAAACIADAEPAGPLQYYPNADQWADNPVAPGVILIGDAAGNNDPTIGQGLSIAMRDVRLVSELLLSSSDWSETSFGYYVEEHKERLRRMRMVAKALVKFRMHYGKTGQKHRLRIATLAAQEPKVAEFFSAQVFGPSEIPNEAFEQAVIDQIYNAI
jgi:2-polyprenyl-6-methoxyphenol hydroxylase-like FAD-dependent oxidoreductase